MHRLGKAVHSFFVGGKVLSCFLAGVQIVE